MNIFKKFVNHCAKEAQDWEDLKKEMDKPKQRNYESTIKILFINGNHVSVNTIHNKEMKAFEWVAYKRLHKWFYVRNTPYYLIEAIEGMITVKRELIVTIEVQMNRLQ